MSIIILGIGDIAGNKTGKDPYSNGVYLPAEGREDKKVNYDALGNHKV